MLTNKQVAEYFNELGSYMDLYGENAFRTKTYKNAYILIRKIDAPVAEMTETELAAVKGIGKSLASKIREIIETGTLQALDAYRTQTPEGIQEMLQIKGFGVKKVETIWRELGIETLGELLYACIENRLILLKGFGEKTQTDLKNKIEYFLKSKDKFRYATLEAAAFALIEGLKTALPDAPVSLVGEMRRCLPVVQQIELLVGTAAPLQPILAQLRLQIIEILSPQGVYLARTEDGFPVKINTCEAAAFGSKLFKHSGTRTFLDGFVAFAKGQDFTQLATENAVFEKAKLPFIAPELREDATYIARAANGQLPELVTETDLKGIIHAHSTYSDGYNSLEEMATYVKAQGYQYLVITDHSKSAFYANGLKPERVWEQMQEIDRLNAQLAPFKIFKGIESDILNDGALDYENDLLAAFEVIIASVHSNLKMSLEKATERLLKAIENPYTTMLGHPTGRLLLSREGYPIDYKKIIDACAANGVSIEVNANPYRLDLDWKLLPYALERGVKIAINPDAHSTQGVHDVRYGTLAARKGGLTAADCLNAFDLNAFENWLSQRVTFVKK